MANPPIFAVGGENLIDHVTRDGQVSAKVGGSPFNVAMGLGRLGAQVRYVSPISTDPWGGMLASALTSSDVALTGGRIDLPTTMARVEINEGIPSYQFEREGTAERAITEADILERIEDVNVVHTGSLTLTKGPDADAWETALAKAHEAGVFVALDPNVRISVVDDGAAYRARIFRMARTATLIKLSDEDLGELYPDLDQDAALDAFCQLASAPLVVLTRGAEGASGFLGEIRVDIEAALVPKLVDAVGAGDTFMSNLLYGLAECRALSAQALGALGQDDLGALLRRASLAASINCGREGCDPPTRSELQEAVA